MTKSIRRHSRAEYDAAFIRARAVEYPELDRFEQLAGIAVNRDRLESAARVLQCPVKVNAPNWQHGRVLYALARQYIAWAPEPTTFLDIGTAKGFSACVLSWAIADGGKPGHRVVSIDIVEPAARVARNSVAECERLLTVHEFVAPFAAPGVPIEFLGGGAGRWLTRTPIEVHVGFAFVDGKHTFDAVASEAISVDKRQHRGDVILFDDTQLSDVQKATMQLRNYRREGIYLSTVQRSYCVAVKC